MKYSVDEETLKEICSEIDEVKDSSINFPMKEMQRLDFEIEAMMAYFNEKKMNQFIRVNDTFKKVIAVLLVDEKNYSIPPFIVNAQIIKDIVEQVRKATLITRLDKELIAHMYSVAELMYKYYAEFECTTLSKELVYVLGLNHDIGLLHGKSNHETNGCCIFSELIKEGVDSLFSKCIQFHGTSPKSYMEINSCKEVDIPKELVLLWWADLNVERYGEHAGEVVGFKERLRRIKENCTPSAYQTREDIVTWLCRQGYESL